MHIFAMVLLMAAVVMTVGFIPLVQPIGASGGPNSAGAAIGFFFLGILRAPVLIGAFLLLAGAGRMEGLTNSRVAQGLTIAGAVLLMELVACVMHFFSIDSQLSKPFPAVFGALAVLLPMLFVGAGLLAATGLGGARILFFAGVGLSVTAGLGAWGGNNALLAEHRANEARMNREAEEWKERRTAELARLPADAGVEALLPFCELEDPARDLALRRIQQIAEYPRQLAAALEGERRLAALYAMHDLRELPEAVQAQGWTAAGELGREFSRRFQSGSKVTLGEIRMLFQSAQRMAAEKGDLREKHLADLEAVRAAIAIAFERGICVAESPTWLDPDIREIKASLQARQ